MAPQEDGSHAEDDVVGSTPVRPGEERRRGRRLQGTGPSSRMGSAAGVGYGVAPQFHVRHVAFRGSIAPLAHMFESQILPDAPVGLAAGSGVAPE
jgi:hypothetical protein